MFVLMKKLLIALLAVVLLFPAIAKPVVAQIKQAPKSGITKLKEVDEFNSAVEANILTKQANRQGYSKGINNDLLVLTFQRIMGGIPQDDGTGGITYSPGMVGNVTQAIAWMINSPAATTERYVADVMNSAGFKIAQPAYAQGLGFASLDPILNTWKTFRNMAYLFFVVLFLVIGFLIMMRQKIGGQAAITAQQAIPQIIVSLLLVTFSYAIAGLVIDLMYVVMYLLLALFQKDQGVFLNKNFLQLGWIMVSNGATMAYEAVQEFSDSMQGNLEYWGDGVIPTLGSITLAVVVALAIALKIVELFFELLKTYVTIVLTIAFSPILLAFGAVPGQNPFKQWMLNLVGNLAAFPTVLLVLIVSDQLTNHISGTELVDNVILEGGGFQPPYLFGSGTAGLMPFIVGLGMLMIMPEIVKEAKKAMGAKEGIFQQLAGKMGDSLGKGWKGGELIPGFAMSDTSKWAGGGLSGGNFARKGAIGAAGLAGGIPYGVATNIRDRAHGESNVRGFSGFIQSVGRGMAATALGTGKSLGDKQLTREAINKRKEEMKKRAEGRAGQNPEDTGRDQL